MKHKDREPEQQLNTAPEFVPEENWSLEEIMREFGGWTKQEEEPVLEETPPEEPSPSVEQVPAEQPEQTEPEGEVMRVAADSGGEKSGLKILNLSGDTIRFKPIIVQQEAEPVPEGPKAEMPEEPDQAEKERQQRRRRRKLLRRERKRQRKQRRMERARKREEPEIVYPSAEEACASYAKGGTLRPRLLISLFLTMISAALLILSQNPIGGLDLTGQVRGLSVAMLALLLVQGLCSAEVLVRGVYQAIRMKFDLLSMLTAAVILTALDAFFAIPHGRAPLCTPAAFLLLMALWGVSLEKQAKWRTLKTVLSMNEPVAAVKVEKVWNGLDGIFRREGDLQHFTAMLETPDAAQRSMKIYAPAALCLTFVMALYSAIRGGGNFIWAWTVLLMASLPAGGFLACWRPFAVMAKRLHREGAAVCGWKGARILSGECGLIICDEDLFPKKNITVNGMKMYSDIPARIVVGYATAVIQAAGSGLLPLFEEMMKTENGRRFTVDTFRHYEGGGLGGEIRGDVVLLGSLGFMRLMGIRVPEGTRVQSAVYVSVNGELAGLFALTYGQSSMSGSGLQNVVHSTGLTPVLATRDFMITPALVKKRYKVSADRLEFPMVAERARLSDPEAGAAGQQGALMSRGNFASFAAAVTGGRLLRRTVHWAVVISVLSGLIGMLLMLLLTYLNAADAASAGNLFLYQLLWQLPFMILTGMIGKS